MAAWPSRPPTPVFCLRPKRLRRRAGRWGVRSISPDGDREGGGGIFSFGGREREKRGEGESELEGKGAALILFHSRRSALAELPRLAA